jgi:hypothetical protein
VIRRAKRSSDLQRELFESKNIFRLRHEGTHPVCREIQEHVVSTVQRCRGIHKGARRRCQLGRKSVWEGHSASESDFGAERHGKQAGRCQLSAVSRAANVLRLCASRRCAGTMEINGV